MRRGRSEVVWFIPIICLAGGLGLLVTACDGATDAQVYELTTEAVSPLFTVSELRPIFAWTHIPGAATVEGEVYDLQVATDSGFTNLIVDEEGMPGTMYGFSDDLLAEDGVYHWRVRARLPSHDETGDWTRTGFRLSAAPDRLLQTATTPTNAPSFSWVPRIDASLHDVEVTLSTDLDFSQAATYLQDSTAGEVYNLDAVAAGLADGEYVFRVRSHSAGGYASDWVVGVVFHVDTTPPVGSFVINDGDPRANDVLVDLDLSAADESGVPEYRSANSEADLSLEDWRPYADTVQHPLTSGDGAKTVYVQFKDTAGNPGSSIPSASVTLELGNVYVHPSGDDSNLGTVTRPYASIQPAVDRADAITASGRNTVYVAGGTYNLGDETLRLRSGARLYGGYSPTDWAVRDKDVYPSIIRHERTTPDSGQSAAVYASYVDGVDQFDVLEGFYIVADRTTLGGTAIGLHLYGAPPRVRNNVFYVTNGTAQCGVFLEQSPNPLISNNVFYVDGPGTGTEMTHLASPLFFHNLFVSLAGGLTDTGVSLHDNANPWIYNNIFHDFDLIVDEQDSGAEPEWLVSNNAYGYTNFYWDTDTLSYYDIAGTESLGDIIASGNVNVPMAAGHYTDSDGSDNDPETFLDNDWSWGVLAPSAVREGGYAWSSLVSTDCEDVSRDEPYSMGPYE